MLLRCERLVNVVLPRAPLHLRDRAAATALERLDKGAPGAPFRAERPLIQHDEPAGATSSGWSQTLSGFRSGRQTISV